MEEVAEAAEASPCSVFRYFSTKADPMVTDACDHQVRDAMIFQPKGMRFAEVLKTAVAESFVDVQPEDFQLFDSRQRLINKVPDLRTGTLDLVAGAAAVFEVVIAKRNLEGRPNPKRLSAIFDLWAVLGARGNKPYPWTSATSRRYCRPHPEGEPHALRDVHRRRSRSHRRGCACRARR